MHLQIKKLNTPLPHESSVIFKEEGVERFLDLEAVDNYKETVISRHSGAVCIQTPSNWDNMHKTCVSTTKTKSHHEEANWK